MQNKDYLTCQKAVPSSQVQRIFALLYHQTENKTHNNTLDDDLIMKTTICNSDNETKFYAFYN